MANYLTGKLKLLYLMRYFIENTDEEHTTTSKAIIEYLEQQGIQVERKAIYSDIEALKQAGMDIISKGKRGGYYLAGGTFELAELKLLVDAVQVSRFITPKKSEELVKKLSGLTSRFHAREFQRDVVIANHTKTPNERIFYNIDRIHCAIAERKEITFSYMEWSLEKKLTEKAKEYRVSPWLLVWEGENYYLVGYDALQRQQRHYRVDKMKNVTLTGEDCKNEDAYHKLDRSAYGRVTFNMFGGSRQKLKIRFDNSLIGVVLDRFGTDISTVPCDKDNFFVYLDIEVSSQFFGWLSGFGSRVKIIEPVSVATDYKWFLLDILRNYN